MRSQEPEWWASHVVRASDFADDFTLLWFLLSSGTFWALVVIGDTKWHVTYSIVYSFSKILCWNSAPSGWNHRARDPMGQFPDLTMHPISPRDTLKIYTDYCPHHYCPRDSEPAVQAWAPPESAFLKSL